MSKHGVASLNSLLLLIFQLVSGVFLWAVVWFGVFSIYDPEETINRGFKGEIKIENVYDELTKIFLNKH